MQRSPGTRSRRPRTAPPQHRVEVVGEGFAREIRVVVELPGVCSMADVVLDAGARSLELQAPGGVRLRCALPELVDPEQAAAKFSAKRGVLTVTLPVVDCSSS